MAAKGVSKRSTDECKHIAEKVKESKNSAEKPIAEHTETAIREIYGNAASTFEPGGHEDIFDLNIGGLQNSGGKNTVLKSVSSKWKIGRIKEKLVEELGVKYEVVNLASRGKALKNERTLASYGICSAKQIIYL